MKLTSINAFKLKTKVDMLILALSGWGITLEAGKALGIKASNKGLENNYYVNKILPSNSAWPTPTIMIDMGNLAA